MLIAPITALWAVLRYSLPRRSGGQAISAGPDAPVGAARPWEFCGTERSAACGHLIMTRGNMEKLFSALRGLRTAWYWRWLRLPLVHGTRRQDEFFQRRQALLSEEPVPLSAQMPVITDI